MQQEEQHRHDGEPKFGYENSGQRQYLNGVVHIGFAFSAAKVPRGMAIHIDRIIPVVAKQAVVGMRSKSSGVTSRRVISDLPRSPAKRD